MKRGICLTMPFNALLISATTRRRMADVTLQASADTATMPPQTLAETLGITRQQHEPYPQRLMFPLEKDGPRSQPTEPSALRSALHEAHLRSPVPVPLRTSGDPPALYRYVCKWALAPQPLDKDRPVSVIDFTLSQADIDQMPETKASQIIGDLPMRVLSEDSRTYRLRCCALPAQGFSDESAWMVSDTVWPDCLYLELNDRILEMRRPLHHKKYLPVDLTSYVKAGTNKLKVIINRTSNNKSPFAYAIAVEVVGVISHTTLLNILQTKQSIPAEETKTAIQKVISGSDDDDLAIVTKDMDIGLFDQHTYSRIFDTPVRGARCAHKDCFDLETFLSLCKRDKPGAATVVDCWRCPICRGDARPSMLVRDEWLMGVRAELERRGRLDTRTIIVQADGSWKEKVEVRTGVRSASLEASPGPGAADPMREGEKTRAKAKVVEVIEID